MHHTVHDQPLLGRLPAPGHAGKRGFKNNIRDRRSENNRKSANQKPPSKPRPFSQHSNARLNNINVNDD